MRHLLLVSVAVVLLVVVNAAVLPPPSPSSKGGVSKLPGTCPTSNPKPTGCYCTTGCGVNGEAADPSGFAYKTPVWPPRKENAAYVSSDTICARITIPTRPTIVGRALTAWLAIGGDIFNNGTIVPGPADQEEVTIYTAFTQRQCSQFQALVSAAYLNDNKDRPSHLYGLRVTLCTTEFCNGPAAFLPPKSPAPITAEAKFPGACPISNPAKTGCFCTSGCSWNAETDGFPWSKPVWPPKMYDPSYVGADTICARITVPIVTSAATSVDLAAALGITGKIYGNTTQFLGAPTGSEVTIYTAFTQAQCTEFMTKATALATAVPDTKKLGIYLCNATNCNAVGAYATWRFTR